MKGYLQCVATLKLIRKLEELLCDVLSSCVVNERTAWVFAPGARAFGPHGVAAVCFQLFCLHASRGEASDPYRQKPVVAAQGTVLVLRFESRKTLSLFFYLSLSLSAFFICCLSFFLSLCPSFLLSLCLPLVPYFLPFSFLDFWLCSLYLSLSFFVPPIVLSFFVSLSLSFFMTFSCSFLFLLCPSCYFLPSFLLFFLLLFPVCLLFLSLVLSVLSSVSMLLLFFPFFHIFLYFSCSVLFFFLSFSGSFLPFFFLSVLLSGSCLSVVFLFFSFLFLLSSFLSFSPHPTGQNQPKYGQ